MRPPPFRLERFFADREFLAPHTLSASDCESLRIADLLALELGALGRFQEQWLGYTETAGAPELRAEIAKLYDTIGPDDVLVHAGARRRFSRS